MKQLLGIWNFYRNLRSVKNKFHRILAVISILVALVVTAMLISATIGFTVFLALAVIIGIVSFIGLIVYTIIWGI